MGNDRRLFVKAARDPAMKVTRTSIRGNRVCYLLVADKRIKYKEGWSRVVYIGTTQKGVGRLANSAAHRAPEVLTLRGVREFTVHVVSCRGRQGIRTWHKLERALLLIFKEEWGEAPKCNHQGRRMKPRDEFEYFSRSRLRRVLHDLR